MRHQKHKRKQSIGSGLRGSSVPFLRTDIHEGQKVLFRYGGAHKPLELGTVIDIRKGKRAMALVQDEVGRKLLVELTINRIVPA